MNEKHIPDPQFVKHLEWELESTMRRRRFRDANSRRRHLIRSRWVTSLLLVVVSACVGGAGTYTVIHNIDIDEQAAKLRVARAEALLEIAKAQLQPLARNMARMQSLAKRGAATRRELWSIEIRFLRAQARADVRELELVETTITGKDPDNHLSAPLVHGRDFVMERLATERAPLQRRVESLTARVQHYREFLNAGTASERELRAIETELFEAESELAEQEARIELRRSFIAGEVSAANVELQGLRAAVNGTKRITTRQMEDLIEERARLVQLAERGVASQAEVEAIESKLRSVEAQLELEDLELLTLDGRIREAAGHSR